MYRIRQWMGKRVKTGRGRSRRTGRQWRRGGEKRRSRDENLVLVLFVFLLLLELQPVTNWVRRRGAVVVVVVVVVQAERLRRLLLLRNVGACRITLAFSQRRRWKKRQRPLWW